MTNKSQSDMPDKVWLRYDKNGLPYWKPITEQPYEDSVLYISNQSHEAAIDALKKENIELLSDLLNMQSKHEAALVCHMQLVINTVRENDKADRDKAIEQAKRETAEKCAEIVKHEMRLEGDFLKNRMIAAIKAVGGCDVS